jgi:hypothetical protein
MKKQQKRTTKRDKKRPLKDLSARAAGAVQGGATSDAVAGRLNTTIKF